MAGKRDVNKNAESGKPKGHIRQRGPSTFLLILDIGRDLHGNRKKLNKTVHGTREDAERELIRLNQQLAEATFIASSGTRVKKFLLGWLDTDARMGTTEKTFDRYQEITVKHLIPAFGHLRLSELNPGHIKAYIQEALRNGRLDGKGGLSNQTVQHHVQVFNRALQDAVTSHLIPYNPATGVKRPRAEPSEIHVYSPREMQMLLTRSKGRRIYLPILLDYATALRRGELLGLKRENVDLDRGVISIVQTLKQANQELYFGKPKTRAGRRQVAISPTIVEALRRHKTEQSKHKLALGPDYQDQGLVFPLEDGSPWLPDSFTTSFRALRISLGLKGTFHDIRHTHATELLRMGVHPKIVSERLGHASIQITLDIYSHVLPDMQQAVAIQLDEALIAIQKDFGI